MQKTRIIHITTVPLSFNFLSGQPRYLYDNGFEVHVISARGENALNFMRREPVQFHPIPMERRITPLRDLIALYRLFRTIRSIRPQIVHTHTPKAGLLGSMAAWLARVPVRIHTVHGLPMMTARGIKRLLLKWSEKIACSCSHQVFSVSQSIREVVVEEKICSTYKIKVIANGSSNGIDALDKFNPKKVSPLIREEIRTQLSIPKDADVLGFVGRVVRDKGIVELAQAWLKLRDEYPNLHLLMIGPIESQDPLPNEITALLNSDPRIHMVGQVNCIVPYYTATDILVLPTYREGLPGVLLEAAAMELPLVATQVPGCVDAAVNGVTGLLVPPKDHIALANALRTYLNSPSLRLCHGQAGRKRVLDDYQPKLIWQELYQTYINLLLEKDLPLPYTSQPEKSPVPDIHRAA